MQAAAPARSPRPRPPTRTRTRRAAALAVTLVLLVALAGCGGDDDDDAASGDEADRGATTESVVTTAPPPGSPSSQGAEGEPGADGDIAAASGDAPAAAGAGLDEPPGDPDRAAFGGFDEAAMAVTTPDGETIGLCVLLALVEQQRQRGLMEVTDMAGYDGMLFAFPQDTETGFWMSNTPMPLSIGWFAADGALVSTEDMAPCEEGDDCPTYNPAGAYRFALEVPQGDLPSLGVEDGSTMAVGGACA
jgi:uncharacterized membrane protein (UPF0127 family)